MPSPQSAEQWQEFWEHMYREALEDPRDALKWFIYMFPSWRGHQSIRYVNYCIEGIMARGKNASKTDSTARSFQPTQFVDIPVVESDWPEIIKVYGTSDALVDAVSDILEAGYRVGLTFNTQNDAFICAVTCRDPESPNNGKTFNSFAETWFEALQIGMYKHYVKSKKNWSGAENKSSRPKFG